MANFGFRIYQKDTLWLDITQKKISNFSIDILCRGNLDEIYFFGVYSNKGTFSFIDVDGKFNKSYDSLKSLEVRFVQYDNDISSNTLINKFLIEDVNYNEETLLTEISLVDFILQLQNEDIQEINEFPSKTLYLLTIQTLGEENVIFSEKAQKTFQEITVNCPYIEKTSKWDFINKICEATMCHCFGRYGKIYIESAFEEGSGEIIGILPRNLYKIPQRFRNNKTKVDSTKVSAKKITKYTQQRVPGKKPSKKLFELNIVGDASSDGEVSCEGIRGVYDEEEENGITCHASFSPNEIYADIAVNFEADAFVHEFVSAELIGNKFLGSGDISNKTFSGFFIKNVFLGSTQNIYDVSENKKAYFSFDGIEIAKKSEDYVTDVHCNVYGNYFVDGGTEEYTKGTSNIPYEISNNDVIQSSNTWAINNSTRRNHAEHLSEEIYMHLRNGLECFEVECNFSKYYGDEYHGDKKQLILNSNEMFQIGSMVVPWVIIRSQYGPISVDMQTGDPKIFVVIGTRLTYSGILRQNLFLQERYTSTILFRG